MHGFTHLLISRRNMALSVVDSVLEVFFFRVSCINLYQRVGCTFDKVALISKVLVTNISVNFVMTSVCVWLFSTSSFLECT